LTTSFSAIYLISQAETGLSGLALKRQAFEGRPLEYIATIINKINTNYILKMENAT
jgi:hypothetical protein